MKSRVGTHWLSVGMRWLRAGTCWLGQAIGLERLGGAYLVGADGRGG